MLCNYKFTLCYENESSLRGLISEKIFDCFYARTIPVFLGASNVQDYFPKDCYVDRREFSSYEELDKYLQNMSVYEYENRILSIENYLKSDSFERFSSARFSECIYSHAARLHQDPSNFYFILQYIKLVLSVLFRKICRIF